MKNIPKIKYLNLLDILKGYDSLIVAFSGGVDSTFLLYAAKEALGDKVVAITAVSETYLPEELEEAKEIAQSFDVKHIIIETSEIENPDFFNNTKDRCYFCKNELFAKIKEVGASLNITNIAVASNVDDLDDYRPGHKAACENEIKTPLIEAGFIKDEIREFLRHHDLPTAQKPANPCLSSRFPYGEKITKEKIAQVANAERLLKSLGFGQFRVRHHGAIARIEVAKNDINKALTNSEKIVKELKDLGFFYVTLDMQGYRMGSLNEVL